MTKAFSSPFSFAAIGTTCALILGLTLSLGASAAHAAITSQLDFGSTGTNVSTLQTYLSTDASLYPSGLVTGYFGLLTQGGVQKFQVASGIVSSGSPATTGYGRVGPTTLAALNARFAGGSPVSWDTAPVMSGVTVQYTGTTATYSWSTNEPTQGQVYWSTSAIQADEATGAHQTPYVSGTLAVDAGGLQTTHIVTVSNLQTNTSYNFFVRSIDSGGNISVALPNSFRTANF